VLAITNVLWLDGCSLGDPVAPTCQVDAAPNEPNACHEVASCDDGMGVTVTEERCCVPMGNVAFANCCAFVPAEMCTAVEDFRVACSGNAGGTCCSQAQQAMDNCMDGVVGGTTVTTGGSGGSTTGGTGGS
jgi:hypothetical protein